MINEAVYTLYEGVGTVEAIDKAMKLGAHHPMGPLELADFIGLDTCLSVMQVLYEGLSDSKYRPVPAAGEVRRGRLAGPQDQPRLLRLPRREAGSDALSVRAAGPRPAKRVVANDPPAGPDSYARPGKTNPRLVKIRLARQDAGRWAPGDRHPSCCAISSAARRCR